MTSFIIETRNNRQVHKGEAQNKSSKQKNIKQHERLNKFYDSDF